MMDSAKPQASGPRAEASRIGSFADIRALMRSLPGADEPARARCAAREARLTKPAGALGRLEEIAAWLAGWQARHPPQVEKPLVCVFAANHGVAGRGVSAYPAEVTAQMVANFRDGGAAINQLARFIGAELRVLALDLDRPTADFTAGPAMDEAETAHAFAQGARAVEPGVDVLCLGEMGIANTTAAAALCLALFGGEAADWVGPGTGVTGAQYEAKVKAVAEAVARNRPAIADPLAALRCVGGRELAAIAGAALAARLNGIPVLLDGYVCTAAAAVLHALDGGALDHCLVAHVSAEPGHRRLVELLGKRPLLDLDMRLGEGTGAALAVNLLRAAVACHTGMATFAEAGVAGRTDGGGSRGAGGGDRA